MYVTKHIDWLSFSIPPREHPSMAFPLLVWAKSGPGSHGWRTRYVDKQFGVTCETDNPDPAERDLYRMSGETLNAIRSEAGMVDDGLSAHIVRLHAKASRIDLTLNIHDGDLTPRKVYEAVKRGTLKSKTRTYRFIEGRKGDVSGDTLYLGSPSADQQFRCYNKSAELGIVDGEAWLRLELELRRAYANGALGSCASNGVVETINGHMGEFIDWGNTEFIQSLRGPVVQPVDIPRRQSNRQRWLLGQVASALAKEIDTDVQFRTLFDRAVNVELENLTKQR